MCGEMNRQELLRPRWLAAVTYALYVLAGVAFLCFGSGLRELMGNIGFLIWTCLLVVGGTVALIGAGFGRRVLEFIGAPGVAVGLLVYSIFIGSQAGQSDRPGVVIGLSAVFAGASLGTAGRAYEIWHGTSIRARVSRKIREER